MSNCVCSQFSRRACGHASGCSHLGTRMRAASAVRPGERREVLHVGKNSKKLQRNLELIASYCILVSKIVLDLIKIEYDLQISTRWSSQCLHMLNPKRFESGFSKKNIPSPSTNILHVPPWSLPAHGQTELCVVPWPSIHRERQVLQPQKWLERFQCCKYQHALYGQSKIKRCKAFRCKCNS